MPAGCPAKRSRSPDAADPRSPSYRKPEADATGPLTAAPIVRDGVVYVQDLDSDVYAITLATGKLRWEYWCDQRHRLRFGDVYDGARATRSPSCHRRSLPPATAIVTDVEEHSELPLA
jgi:glucose dehydrogenase